MLIILKKKKYSSNVVAPQEKKAPEGILAANTIRPEIFFSANSLLLQCFSIMRYVRGGSVL